MRTFVMFAMVSMLFAFSACEKNKEEAGNLKPVDLTARQQQVINSSNAFGFDFFRKACQVSAWEQNFMVSPLSVSMALGMTRNGAAGSTLDSMTATLGFAGMSDQEINESYQYLVGTFSGLDPRVKLTIANSIWYRNTFSVEQAFIETNKNYFDAEVNALDFDSPDAVGTINAWVSEKTSNLIPKIIDQIPDETVMYLVNAVYFKGQWRYRFDDSKTQPEPFTLLDGTVIEAPAMLQRTTLPMLKGNGFVAAELPYNQGNFTMTILLPDIGVSPAEIAGRLTQQNWDAWKSSFFETDMQVQLPRFKFAYDEKLMKDILTAMGMGIAFDDQAADFSRINPEYRLYISEVKHKTCIETNEEGTEAAAVTSVGVGTTSAGEDPVPYPFTVNRPFLFFISEKSTGTILFIGSVLNPLQP